MFNPLPAIALMPLALLWFGLGVKSLIFVIVHSVLWPMSLNTYTGFVTVPQTLRRVGQNFGLDRLAAGGGHPAARGVPVHPLRHQDRLGLRLADHHRGRDGVRRGGQPGRARLVHLPEPLRDEHRPGLRRALDRDPHRPHRREPRLPVARAADRAPLGHEARRPSPGGPSSRAAWTRREGWRDTKLGMWAWLLQRVAAVALALVVALHLGNPFVRPVQGLLLALVLLHGLLGVRAILLDVGLPSPLHRPLFAGARALGGPVRARRLVAAATEEPARRLCPLGRAATT